MTRVRTPRATSARVLADDDWLVADDGAIGDGLASRPIRVLPPSRPPVEGERLPPPSRGLFLIPSRSRTKRIFSGRSSTRASTKIRHSGQRSSLCECTISSRQRLQKVCWHGKTLLVLSSCSRQTEHSSKSVKNASSMPTLHTIGTLKSFMLSARRTSRISIVFHMLPISPKPQTQPQKIVGTLRSRSTTCTSQYCRLRMI